MARKSSAAQTSETNESIESCTLNVEQVPESIMPGQAWTMIRLPVETVTLFGTKARVSVRIEIGDESFSTSIMPTGDGHHHLMFNKGMQAAAAKTGWVWGEKVAFRVIKDDQPRPELPIPQELVDALSADQTATKLFEKLAPSHRKEYARYVSEAKRPETRVKRAAKCIETINAGLKPDF